MSLKEQPQKSPTKRFLFVLGLLMFTLYLILGVAIVFWKDLPIQMDLGYRIAFGVLLIVYAFFRFIRLLRN